MKIVIRESTHNDYKWEVYAPKKLFGKLIRKGFNLKPDAQRYKGKLLGDLEEKQTPLDPKLRLVVARYQNDLTVEQIENALQAKLEDVGKSIMSFKEVCAAHLEDLERLLKRKAVGADHVRDYKYAGPKLDHWLGGPSLSEINEETLNEFIDDQLDRPGHEGTKSPRTVKNYIDQISAILNFAIRKKWITNNATHEITMGHYKPEVAILKPREIIKLLKHAGWLMRAFIMFGAFGGCRSSEIRLIRWEDVRLEDNQFYIPGKKNVCAERWVTLTPPLRAYCEQMLTPPPGSPPDWKRTGLVLKGVCYATIARHRVALVEESGQTIPRNALRHSFGSHHLVQYKNPNVTAVEMGHHSPQTTYAFYRKAVRKAQAVKFWDVRIGEQLEEDIPANLIAA